MLRVYITNRLNDLEKLVSAQETQCNCNLKIEIWNVSRRCRAAQPMRKQDTSTSIQLNSYGYHEKTICPSHNKLSWHATSGLNLTIGQEPIEPIARVWTCNLLLSLPTEIPSLPKLVTTKATSTAHTSCSICSENSTRKLHQHHRGSFHQHYQIHHHQLHSISIIATTWSHQTYQFSRAPSCQSCGLGRAFGLGFGRCSASVNTWKPGFQNGDVKKLTEVQTRCQAFGVIFWSIPTWKNDEMIQRSAVAVLDPCCVDPFFGSTDSLWKTILKGPPHKDWEHQSILQERKKQRKWFPPCSFPNPLRHVSVS